MWCENSDGRVAAATTATVRLFLCDTEIKIDSDYIYAFMCAMGDDTSIKL